MTQDEHPVAQPPPAAEPPPAAQPPAVQQPQWIAPDPEPGPGPGMEFAGFQAPDSSATSSISDHHHGGRDDHRHPRWPARGRPAGPRGHRAILVGVIVVPLIYFPYFWSKSGPSTARR